MKKINFAKEAFILSYNLIFVVGFLLFGLIGNFFMPASLIVVAVEIIYMTFVPASPAFQRHVKGLYQELAQADKKNLLKQMASQLNGENRQKFSFIQDIAHSIQSNYKNLEKQDPTAFVLLQESMGKLDYLRESFLRLLLAYQNYTFFLKDRSIQELESKLGELEKERERASGKSAQLIEKRISIQQKRLERLKKIKANSLIIIEQLKTIEDLLLFMQEQSLAVLDPSEINQQLSSLFVDIESAEAAAQEMAAIMSNDFI